MGLGAAGLMLVVVVVLGAFLPAEGSFPLVITTWNYTEATTVAWSILQSADGSAVDAVERGCGFCEESPHLCRDSVGFGGKPDEDGETTLDAMIMDGTLHEVGAVGALRRVKKAISVARKVMEHTEHTLLVGDQATKFALQMGFKEENLTTNRSAELYEKWLNESCQPNKWKNVEPDPKLSCGPYRPVNTGKMNLKSSASKEKEIDIENHDTIGMLAIDSRGHISVGTSTNGLRHKIPGRVGDSPIPGSGAYVDKLVGGAVATGNGDVMMRFMPTLMTVEWMRSGLTPSMAAEAALRRIVPYYPTFGGAVLAANIDGEYGASCFGYKTFPFTVVNATSQSVTVMKIPCFT